VDVGKSKSVAREIRTIEQVVLDSEIWPSQVSCINCTNKLINILLSYLHAVQYHSGKGLFCGVQNCRRMYCKMIKFCTLQNN
jgi:hypothetical protein